MEEIKKADKKQLVILIIAGILIFLIGGGLGIISAQKGPQQIKVQAVNNLSSKVVSSIVAYGKVQNIQGRNITLSNLGDNLVISIASNAQVYAFITPAAGKNNETPAPVQQTVNFTNIKIGDNVNVAVKLLPTGQMQGSAVIILPSSAK